MPSYATAKSVGGQSGVRQVVWNGETPASGAGGASASMAVALPKQRFHGDYGFNADLEFAGNPGVFEVDVQVANVDADNQYVSIGQITAAVLSADGVTYIATAEFATNTRPFVRLLNKTANANAVAQTAGIMPA